MIGNNQTSNKTKDKLILSPIRRETELFLVGAKCEGVWRGRGQARNEEGNMIVITEDYVPFFFFTGKQMEDLHRNHASGTGPYPVLLLCSISVQL